MSEDNEKKLHLSKAHLTGFKSIKDLEFELKPGLNILIGKNGSGKSNLLEFLNGVLDAFYSRIGPNYRSADITILGSGNVAFHYSTKKHQLRLSDPNDVMIDQLYQHKLSVDDVVIYNDFDESLSSPTFEYKGKKYRIGTRFFTALPKLGYGYFMPLYIKFNMPQYLLGFTAPGRIYIMNDKSMDWEIHLHGFLHHAVYLLNDSIAEYYFDLQEDHSDEIAWKMVSEKLSAESIMRGIKLEEDVRDNLALYTPIKDYRISDNINVTSDESSLTINNIFVEYLVNGQWLPWSHLSDGTRRMFYIISEVTVKHSGLILIEEPELGIHPHQFHLIMKFLEEQARHKQIIISTHSPKTLDVLGQDELDQIMIAEYDKAKGTQIKRMTELQKEKAKGYMRDVGFLSDYWLMSDLEEWSELD